MAEKEIYYVGFPSGYMMTYLEPVAFEILGIEEKVLRIKLLEDHPPLEGIESALLPKAGKEYTISRIHLLVGKECDILDKLRSGNVVPWYNSNEGEDHFDGVLFPKKKR